MSMSTRVPQQLLEVRPAHHGEHSYFSGEACFDAPKLDPELDPDPDPEPDTAVDDMEVDTGVEADGEAVYDCAWACFS